MTSTSFRPDNKPCELVVFDVRESGVIERLLSERAGGAARIAERRAA